MFIAKTRLTTLLFIAAILFVIATTAHGEEKQKKGGGPPGGRPPARVVVSDVTGGMIVPEGEFVGTVYYREVSDLASEVSGRVDAVHFEEGQRVREGHPLVTINADILGKTLQAMRASYEQVLADMERAGRELERNEGLFREELISEKEYDNYRFLAQGLEKRGASLLADVERLEVELKKKGIAAPFDGVVLQRHVDRGEWLSPGSPVATIGNDAVVDIIVDISERIIPFAKVGSEVDVTAAGATFHGRLTAVVPKGDISTRTFPVKIRVKNDHHLKEGMEARVRLPQGKRV
ncbi:MAG: efflux RND transporter periplasmic adaptor subunit, partial [Thermodesulfobacteriota bacterium]